MKIRFEAQVIDEDVYIPDENMDGVLAKISAPTMEMLEEQLGKLEKYERK